MLAKACKVNISYVEMKIVSKHLMMKPTKLHTKKAPKKGREKKTRGKDQSPGRQIAHLRGKGTTKYQNFH
jgi:hypothetical protein